jgi:hypothetical protein
VAVPGDIPVLSLEHTEDPVPVLDGTRNVDRGSWVTVTAEAAGLPRHPAGGPAEPVVAHRLELYRRTAAAVDGSADPSLVAWREGLAPFLAGPGVRVHQLDVAVSHPVPR